MLALGKQVVLVLCNGACLEMIRVALALRKIELVCQPPHHLLDVAIWMGVQSTVEKKSRKLRDHPEALWSTVQNAGRSKASKRTCA